MKRVLSAIVSMIMLITTVCALPFNALAWNEIDGGVIAAGDTKIVDVSVAGQQYCYTFTPAEDGTYLFYSNNIKGEDTCDAYGYLCNADGTEIVHDDDSNGNRQFKIERELTGGTTYKLKANIYSEDLTGKFQIFLGKKTTVDGGTASTDSVTNVSISSPYQTVVVKIPNTLTDSKKYYFVLSNSESKPFDYEFYKGTSRLAISSNNTTFIRDFDYYENFEFTFRLYFHDADNTGTISIKLIEYSTVDGGAITVGETYNGTISNCAEYHEYSFTTEGGYYYFDFTADKNIGTSVSTVSGSGEEHTDFAYFEKGTYLLSVFSYVDEVANFSFKANQVTPTDSGALSLEAPTDVVYKNRSVMRYTFTPAADGVYSFTTEGQDTYGYLFDKSMNLLAYNDDTNSGNRNFTITRYLEKGKTYYVDARMYSVVNNADFKVMVTDVTSTHEHSFNNKNVAVTCTEDGYTEQTCTVCSYVTKDNITPALGHEIANETTTPATLKADGSYEYDCTRCGKHFTEVISRPAKFTLSNTAYVYANKAFKPAVTVTDAEGKAVDAANYTVTYKNNKNVGKATVTITFKGNYSGTKTLTFKINPKGTALSKLTAGKKQITVQWKKQATQTTGYQIQYATNAKFTKSKTVKVAKNATVKTTIKKLTSNKKYYVRIRTYKTVSGVNYYSSWSKSKNIKVK